MKTDTCTVFDLFDQPKRHLVPLFQRPYVWNQDEHWAPLWEDISTKAESLLKGQETSPHFLGAVVRAQVPTTGSSLDARLIIDGQQRLTTFQVFFAVLRDLASECRQSAEDLAIAEALATTGVDLERVTANTGRIQSPDERSKVFPTQADREVFKSVMHAKSRSTLDAQYPVVVYRKRVQKNPNPLVEAYRFFDGELRKYLDVNGGVNSALLDRLDAIINCARRMLLLVVIDLGPEEDPQIIFETLNDRGAELLASDLIKNFVFGRTVSSAQDIESLYKKYWSQFDQSETSGEQTFWKSEVRQGRLMRRRIDIFFEHFLVAKTGGEFFVSRHLYPEFKRWWGSKSGVEPELILAEIQDHAEVYESFYRSGQASNRQTILFERLQAMDTTTLYPFLLFLLAGPGRKLSQLERDSILADLESYLVRRWICGRTGKSYNRFFGALLRDIEAGVVNLSSLAIRERLANATGNESWPTDEQFRDAWETSPAYTSLKSRGVQMVLLAINEELRSKLQEDIVVRGSITVEHVLPQSWSEHWTDESDEDGERRAIIHTFGNLTIVSGPLNSKLSNSKFEEKKVWLTESSLRMNRYFMSIEDWNEQTIKERSKALFEVACRIWPKHQASAPT